MVAPMGLTAGIAPMLRIVSVLWLALGVPPLGAAPFELPPAQRGADLADCRAKLDEQGGGWCEIRLPGAARSPSQRPNRALKAEKQPSAIGSVRNAG